MQTARYINPLTDFGFKKVFGNEDIMCDFLNDIIEPKSPIVKVTFLDKEMPLETKYERGIIYDMRCLLDSGEEVIVEMQNRAFDYFKDRFILYTNRAVSSIRKLNNKSGETKDCAIHCIFLTYFNLDKEIIETEQKHDIRHVAFADKRTHKIFSEKLHLWFIEFPRFNNMSKTDCKTKKDYWLYILTHLKTIDTAIPFKTQNPIFQQLENIADMDQLTSEELYYYRNSLDAFRTNLAVMDHERNEGRAEGRAEGLVEGRAEGLAEGERKATLANALSLKLNGVPTDIIAKSLGLTIEEVERLK